MSTAAQTLQTLIDKELERPHSNSVLLRVESGDGSFTFEGSAGHGTPQSQYFIASITKMFTASVIMQLVDEGRIALDDPITRTLDHLPLGGIHIYKGTDYSRRLTIRQLLHQTSGLADYFANGLDADFKAGRDRFYSVEDVLEIVRGMTPSAAPDSGRSHYSDTNYQLLGALIEQATGQPLAEAFKTRLFDPLGMAETYLYDHTAPPTVEPIPFYSKDAPIFVPQAMSSERGTGGAVSTMADSILFLRAYFRGALFDKGHFPQMMAWNRMFFPMQYGYGLWRFQLPRWLTLFRKIPEFIGHAGVNGAMAFYNPDKDLFIAGTLNQIDTPARQFSVMPKIVAACA